MSTGTDAVRVLVVDDETAAASTVADSFRREGFDVVVARDGREALRAAWRIRPDLVILEVALPGMDGVEVCRRLRGFSAAYVLVVTVCDQGGKKIDALTAGADDYVVKPASPRELLARAGAMLRRPRVGPDVDPATGQPGHGEPVVRLGDLEVDRSTGSATLGGQALVLTRTEVDLLATLAARPKRVFTRRQLVDAVWGPDWTGDEHIVDVHLSHLRRTLRTVDRSQLLRTVRGIGYAIRPPAQAPAQGVPGSE